MIKKEETKEMFPFAEKVAFVGTYSPRQCGIATFTTDLRSSIANYGHDIKNFPVIAMDDRGEGGYQYPEEVEWTIYQPEPQDYIRAFNYLNRSDCKLVCLQHEYGIFGGDHGAYILDFLAQLKLPIVTTLHTVFKEPTVRDKKIIAQMASMISKFVVMTPIAKKFLTQSYDVPKEQIEIIPHGIPEVPTSDPKHFKNKLNLKGRTILLTFGLLNANKGIETVLQALPDVVRRFPKIAYIILGATHPVVKKREGEAYRIYLNRLVKELGLEDHVFFHDQFVSLEQLTQYFSASDVYVTPYLSEKQITSGTLAYASGCGIPTLSTPYWHAQDLLANGSGRLFPFKNYEILRAHLLEMLGNPKLMASMREKALAQGREMTWPAVGRKHIELFQNILAARKVVKKPARFVSVATELPKMSLQHVERLTDNVGMLQHATGIVPNRKEGYCIDDNARALIMTMWHYKQTESAESLDLATTYLSYIQYAQKDDGTFHNYMDYQRQFLDTVGSEDSMGRTLWALGYTIRYCNREALRIVAKDVFYKSRSICLRFDQHLRAKAFALLGLCHYLKHAPTDEEVKKNIFALADDLVERYKANSSGSQQWFEEQLTYDNAFLPLALLKVYRTTGNKKYLPVGLNTLNFLQKTYFTNDHLQLVGNEGWLRKAIKGQALYDEQPLDAASCVLMFKEAYHCTKKKAYLDLARKSFAWFTGKNRLETPLYDFESNGCFDGLQEYGVNQNQGAESVVSYLIALMTMIDLSHIEPVEEGSV